LAKKCNAPRLSCLRLYGIIIDGCHENYDGNRRSAGPAHRGRVVEKTTACIGHGDAAIGSGCHHKHRTAMTVAI